MDTENPVVIDLGSESIKAGYASNVPSEHEPRIVTPSLVTVYPRPGRDKAAAASKDPSNNEPRTVHVIDHGFVNGMDCLDSVLHYLLYDQLGWIKGQESSVLFVEPLFVGKAERELLTQLMFEGYNVAGLFLHDAAALALFAAGRLNGCSVDIGHGKVDIATVSEGVMHAPGAVRMSFAGQQLTQALGHVLAQQQPGLQQLSQQQLGQLKVQCCQAAPSHEAYQQLAAAGGSVQQDPGQQLSQQQQQQQQLDQVPLGSPQEYTLPDGTKINVTTEGLAAGEALLQPGAAFGQPPSPGLVDCIIECVDELPDVSARRLALEGVLLCGGGACMQGLSTRVLHDLRSQLPGGLDPRLAGFPEYMCMPTPQYAPWVGGAIMAKLAAYQSHFMIKAEYEEIGPHAVHRKCA